MKASRIYWKRFNRLFIGLASAASTSLFTAILFMGDAVKEQPTEQVNVMEDIIEEVKPTLAEILEGYHYSG